MLIKLRPNLFIGDENAGDKSTLKNQGITAIVVVADEMVPMLAKSSDLKILKIGMVLGPNYEWIKDLACHSTKYLMQHGETVLVQSKTGLRRGAYVAARAACEEENRSIYEIFQEIKKKEKKLDLSKVYF